MAAEFALSRQRAEVIAEEIALNHAKSLNVEIATPSYVVLGERMNKLDFTPIAAAPVAVDLRGDGWRVGWGILVGGIYVGWYVDVGKQRVLGVRTGRRG